MRGVVQLPRPAPADACRGAADSSAAFGFGM